MFDDDRPIFLQLADRLAGDILRGIYAEGDHVPSTNELAAHLRINPATAGKALGVLVDRGILFKRRGLGMYVADGAKQHIADDRQREFAAKFVQPLLAEARELGLSVSDVLRRIEEAAGDADTADAADPAQHGTDGTTHDAPDTERGTS
ncbi:GntR family transcriptional regulator [Leucobacter sp. GX24907]